MPTVMAEKKSRRVLFLSKKKKLWINCRLLNTWIYDPVHHVLYYRKERFRKYCDCFLPQPHKLQVSYRTTTLENHLNTS